MTERQAFQTLALATILHLIEPMEPEELERAAQTVVQADRTMKAVMQAMAEKQETVQ
jgi:hypothetical protein